MEFSFFTKPAGTKKTADALTLIIDIESGLVRGSLVLFSQNKDLPHILYTTSSEIKSRGNGPAGVRLLSAMIEAVAAVSENAVREGLKVTAAHSVYIPILKAHVIFSSPWIISKTKTVTISYEKETEIVKATVNSILDSERHSLEQRFLSEHDSSLEFDLVFVEQKIFEVKLNGYPTTRFENKKARELEVSFAISISSKSILDRIEKTIEKSVLSVGKNIQCHSSLLLQYAALRTLVMGGNDYIALHIHNEISDVIVVKKGVCAALASFPSGTTSLSESSALALGQSKETAISSLNLQSKNVLHPLENQRVVNSVSAGISDWAQQFMAVLATLGPTDSIPRRVYLLANEHYSHFGRALEDIKTEQIGQFFTVIPIEKSILDSSVTQENKQTEDPLMSLYVFALQ